jgi:peptidoglycan/xylan/chitin deacetylase (PgdA/CDA1 family)
VSAEAWRPSTFLRASVGLHAAGAAALALTPGRWPLVIGGLLLDHAVIGAAALWPRSTLLGANVTRIEAAAGAVALTFDDGPDPEVTPAILARLERRAATATFFCIGRKVEAHRDLVAEIHRRGHRVENHTLTHPHAFGFYGPRAMEREIGAAQDVIASATGRAPRLFRAPVGIRNPWLDPVLGRAGLRLVSWTRRGFDTVGADARRIADRLLRGVRAGDILLLHDGSSVRDRADRAAMLDALDHVLDGLEAGGLRAVAIPGET